MTKFVSMQQADLPYSFTKSFSEVDAMAILSAVPGDTFKLEGGVGYLPLDDDAITLTLKSPGGCRHTHLNYEEICRQLRGS
ncbi:hypothetical protein L1889_18250 [Paenalcaligenes niemegkensis]|uniref:hypothetical protein n=1 Tax=Paenalcaligenes niemegkensis TaxID=2895469 RepID=UPI001EE95EC4|nr:hypothetical protein [Paenalcaligenes niemegkensis]MCQ9618382.1 hypothetical protein [Paenalcaligenes niemegkensis]